jgi:hypothetical protein
VVVMCVNHLLTTMCVTVSENVTFGFLETIGSISFVSEGLELDECSPLLHSEHDDREQ